jgi:hypothetical protein
MEVNIQYNMIQFPVINHKLSQYKNHQCLSVQFFSVFYNILSHQQCQQTSFYIASSVSCNVLSFSFQNRLFNKQTSITSSVSLKKKNQCSLTKVTHVQVLCKHAIYWIFDIRRGHNMLSNDFLAKVWVLIWVGVVRFTTSRPQVKNYIFTIIQAGILKIVHNSPIINSYKHILNVKM